MTNEDVKKSCVLIPCSERETWAVPQICLAEILTVHTDADEPPAEVEWRGRSVPVMDLGSAATAPWQSAWHGSGLVAIFLGLKGEGCEYWGVAVRGGGLRVEKVAPEQVVDAPEEKLPHATAAFRLNDQLCQVPDLDTLQKKIAQQRQVA